MCERDGNYEFIIDQAVGLAACDFPRVLDFGCGTGRLISLGLSRGIDVRGVDTFSGHYADWQEQVPPECRDRIERIDRSIPFPDGHFDVVVSNQVFEHVADPQSVLPEIRRVLKPGGAFLALFPVRETWYEGHVGLYFAGRLQRRPRLLRGYLSLASRFGAGLHRGGMSHDAWASESARVVREVCFYHRRHDIWRWWREAFGEEPSSLAAEYVAFRLGHLGLIRRRSRARS